VYCDFFFRINLRLQDQMERKIIEELGLYRERLHGLPPVKTLYLGGGTPSLASPSFLTRIREILDLSSCEEFTIEANPEDITREWIREWVELGVTRISVGIQSLVEEDLRWLGRVHGREKGYRSLERLAQENVHFSVDLLVGLPSGKEMDTVEEVLQFGPKHISVYLLTVEEGTVLWKEVIRGVRTLPEETEVVSRYRAIRERLLEKGYEHYEISNYALPGYASLHNQAYWERKSYLGIGPSAHSFRSPKFRWWNCSSFARYQELVSEKRLPWDGYEMLADRALYNEEVMLGFRFLRKGVDVKQIRKWRAKEADWLVEANLIQEKEGRYYLTETGLLYGDEVIRRLMV